MTRSFKIGKKSTKAEDYLTLLKLHDHIQNIKESYLSSLSSSIRVTQFELLIFLFF